MALIACPNCGQTMSDKAAQCPHCGWTSNDTPMVQEDNDVKGWWLVLDFFFPIVGIILFFVGKPNKATAKAGLWAAIAGFVISMLLI